MKIKNIIAIVLSYLLLFNTSWALDGSQGYLDESSTKADESAATVQQGISEKDAQIINLLTALKIITQTDATQTVTVSEFCDMAKKAFGTAVVYDKAEEPATYLQAVEIALNALGYGFLQKGSYNLVAFQIGLTKGVEVTNPLTVLTASKLIYNGLNTERLVPNGLINGRINYVTYKDDTYLKTNHNITKYEGVLNAVGNLSYVGGDSDLEQGQCSVGDYIFNIGDKNIDDLLGSNVIVFAKYDDETDDTSVLTIMENIDNIKKTINLEDITGYTDEYLKYTDENDKDQKITFDKNISMVYNNNFVYPFDKDLFAPYYQDGVKTLMSGNLNFIDQNGDKKIDLVAIDAYRVYTVGTVYKLKGYFVDDNKKQNKVYYTSENDDSIEYSYILNGGKGKVTDVKSDAIVCVYAGTNSKRIAITNKKLSGTISKTIGSTYTINEKDYEVSPYYENLCKTGLATPLIAGDTIAFWVDVEGKIANVTKSTAVKGSQYVYVIGKSSGIGLTKAQIKVIDKNGTIEVLTFADSVKVNGVSKKTDRDAISAINAKGKYTPANIIIKNELITEINVNTKIEKPTDLQFRRPGGTISGEFYLSSGGSYKMDSSTVFLGIGFDKDGNVVEDYIQKLTPDLLETRPVAGINISTFGSLFTMVDNDEDTVKMVIMDIYPNTDTENWVLSPVKDRINEYTPFSLTDKSSWRLFVVNEVMNTINSDNVATKMIIGLTEGKEKKYVLAEDVVYETQPKIFGGYSGDTSGACMWTPETHQLGWTHSVREGDILVLVTNKDDEISEVIWIANATALPKQTMHDRSIRQYMQRGTTSGFVTKYEGSNLTINNIDDGSTDRRENSQGFTFDVNRLTSIYRYNIKNNKFELCTKEDIYPSEYSLDINPADGYRFNTTVANNLWIYGHIEHLQTIEAVMVDYADMCDAK